MRKLTIKGELEWDEVLNIACTYCNSFPNDQSQESGFFLMFWRDAYIPMLANLLQPKLRYLGDKSSLLSIEMLRETYMLVAVNIKRARDRQLSKIT